MAIIDILTPYDAKKKAAHAAKTVKHGVSSPRLRLGPGGRPSGPQGAPAQRRLSCPLALPGCLVFSLCHLHPVPTLQLAEMPNLFFPKFSGSFPSCCWACGASC